MRSIYFFCTFLFFLPGFSSVPVNLTEAAACTYIIEVKRQVDFYKLSLDKSLKSWFCRCREKKSKIVHVKARQEFTKNLITIIEDPKSKCVEKIGMIFDTFKEEKKKPFQAIVGQNFCIKMQEIEEKIKGYHAES